MKRRLLIEILVVLAFLGIFTVSFLLQSFILLDIAAVLFFCILIYIISTRSL
jgi:hypothetical protein